MSHGGGQGGSETEKCQKSATYYLNGPYALLEFGAVLLVKLNSIFSRQMLCAVANLESISPSLFETLVCHYIYSGLIDMQHKVYSRKVGRTLSSNKLMKLRVNMFRLKSKTEFTSTEKNKKLFLCSREKLVNHVIGFLMDVLQK